MAGLWALEQTAQSILDVEDESHRLSNTPINSSYATNKRARSQMSGWTKTLVRVDGTLTHLPSVLQIPEIFCYSNVCCLKLLDRERGDTEIQEQG